VSLRIQKLAAPRWQKLLDRLGVSVGGSEPVELLNGVIATTPLPNTDLLCSGFGQLGATAAERSMIQLFNPASSPIDIIPVLAHVYNGTTATNKNCSLCSHDAALTTLSATVGPLTRPKGNLQGINGEVRTLSGVSAGTTIGGMLASADDVDLVFEFPEGSILEPGRGLLWRPNANQVAMAATWVWYERVRAV